MDFEAFPLQGLPATKAGASTHEAGEDRGHGRFPGGAAFLVFVVALFADFAAPRTADALELRMVARQGPVREAADPNSRLVATVPAGVPLRVLRELEAWYLVDLTQREGPAIQGYVSLSDAEWVAECDPKSAGEIKPGGVFQDCDVAPRMTVIPAGTFIMGSPESEPHRHSSEGPQREVTIPAPFAVGVFEVTHEEWESCVRMDGCGGLKPDDEGFGRGRRPVLNISWHAAQLYTQWLSDLTGKRYRLLSEAEWEYAARAGSTTVNYWRPEDDFCEFASVYDKTDNAFHNFDFQLDAIIPCDDGFAGTAPAGSFQPNSFGLHDMIGNAGEWTQDCFNSDYSGGPTDGSAWESGLCFLRVARGGGWFYGAEGNRSAIRTPRLAKSATSVSGFRVARDLK
ncbi:MAG: SUMF1/EgtB/PvdO family nonheme iron enzyme [Nitrospira sp. SB0677_bin_15]|nr:SUMF1/EgtB/PvdO family nonheme iron enzyme [Nitrospira sp. SB0667_bin_9]MYD30428.1 SUMF1/EgtB/PvdO family nonheme iron enzyme [Nitrospira sp. SB0661_bin_20]MYG39758.1 SUMF1/EgtB/PvdO family nonheme iron enzyme [Nitrospira sp. SB0677_bin_15]